jgi:hypothetical protein
MSDPVSKSKEEDVAERKINAMIDLLIADLKQCEISNKESIEKQFQKMS